MARIRTIKPEFPQSESMGRVSREARLCFILLWTLADDEGRLRGNSRMLASLLFPYDDDASDNIDGWLRELETEGCLVRYQVDGTSYLEISKWLFHQKIDKPSKSKFPSKDEGSIILASPREHSLLDQGSRIKGSKDQVPRILDQGTDLDILCEPPPATAPAKKSARSSEQTPLQKASAETWEAYSAAYRNRYRTDPVRNGKVNGQIAQFVQRLGFDESPAVAAFYVGHNQQFYVSQMHAFGLALKDAEKLRTEWVTGTAMTTTRARQADRTGSMLSIVEELKRERGEA